jgi:beta-lactam-binding protein with PASTA domain
VTIVVSTGRQQAEVPSVIGLPEVEARAAIRNAGLVVERTLTPSDTVEQGLGHRVQPRPGRCRRSGVDRDDHGLERP